MHENFRQKNFSETPKCSPMKYFGTVRQKLRRKIVILPPPPPPIQTISIPEIIATVKDSSTEIFGTVRQKFSTENCNTPYLPPPPLLSIKFFDTRNFVKHRRVHLRNFRHCETKNIRRKILILPPSPLSINFFDNRNFLQHRKFPVFGTVRQKKIDRKS